MESVDELVAFWVNIPEDHVPNDIFSEPAPRVSSALLNPENTSD